VGRIAYVLLSALSLASLVLVAVSAWKLWSSPASTWLVERAEAGLSAHLERLLAREVTPSGLEARLTDLLNEEPRDWVRIDAVVDLAAGQSVSLDRGVAARVEDARARDHGILQRGGYCFSCAWNVANCDIGYVVACRLPIEISPLGDVGSILRQSSNYVRGQSVDGVEMVLATVGLGAVAMVPMTGGTSLTIKTGAGLAKTAYRVGALSPGIVAAGRKAATDAIDWSILARSSPRRFVHDLERAIRHDALRPVVAFVRDVESLNTEVGTTAMFAVLRRVDTVEDARGMTRVARSLKDRTVGAVEIVGKQRLIRATMRFSDEIYALVAGITLLVGSVLGLLLTAGKSFFFGALRRRARRYVVPRRGGQ
jgi:hypothetical protein